MFRLDTEWYFLAFLYTCNKDTLYIVLKNNTILRSYPMCYCCHTWLIDLCTITISIHYSLYLIKPINLLFDVQHYKRWLCMHICFHSTNDIKIRENHYEVTFPMTTILLYVSPTHTLRTIVENVITRLIHEWYISLLF